MITSRVWLIVAGLATLAVAAGAARAGAPSDAEAARGRAVFETKQCNRCHRPRGEAGTGPSLESLQRPQGAWEFAGRLWNHAPSMFTALSQAEIPWPVISPAEMADLMVYLRSDAARDPAPDPVRGEALLVRKGCLKCHSLRREGGRTAPELAERRPVYDSAAAWASSMWTHTPRMAVIALERGVLYPRFSDDELGHLVGFLRSSAVASRQ